MSLSFFYLNDKLFFKKYVDLGLFHIPEKEVFKLKESFLKQETLISKVEIIVRSIFCKISFFFKKIICLFRKRFEFFYPNSILDNKSKGLFVFIHGFNSSPGVWNDHIVKLEVDGDGYDFIRPSVPERGRCSLDKAIEPIETLIDNYIKKFPEKPICFISHSNGSRIALELEDRLRKKAPTTPVKVSSVAGAVLGTKRIDFINKLRVGNTFCGRAFADEMRYLCDHVKCLWEKTNKALPDGVVRSYDFFASTEDVVIRPVSASFPLLKDKDVRYFMVPNESHSSIINKVREFQLADCILWMEKNKIKESLRYSA